MTTEQARIADTIAPVADMTASVARLFIYPVKSCAGVEVKQAVMTQTGLDFDRTWMVVDEQGRYVTQRELPRMALIKPQMRHSDMVLRAPGMLSLHIGLDAVEAPATVHIWKDEVPAWDMGPIAAQWFSDFLGRKLRLVRFDPEVRRVSDLRWTGGVEALTQFSDGFAVLVVSDASLHDLNARLEAAGQEPVTIERFRPNIVLAGVDAHDEDRVDVLRFMPSADSEEAVELKAVKPCPRCPIPNVDPSTGVFGPAVGDMLQTYRRNDAMKGAVTFGMNMIGLGGFEQTLAVGQAVTAAWRFD